MKTDPIPYTLTPKGRAAVAAKPVRRKPAVHPQTLDDCLRRLEAMSSSTHRRDYKVTAQLARRIILDLTSFASSPTRRLEFTAQRISEAAAVRPQLAYRTLRTGEIRMVRKDARAAARIPPGQIVGTYDVGCDWRLIMEDLQA